jgi:isopenicillin-N N-acyltransferase-like protein
MLKVQRDNGPDVLTYSDYGFPAGYGVNSEGITVVWNSVHCEISRPGVPTYLLVREVLHQKLLSDVIDRLIELPRADSLNFILADKNGEIYNFEATPDDYDLTYGENSIVHANHFVSDKLQVERDICLLNNSDTVYRHNRMTKLINQRYGNIGMETAMQFQQDHANYPSSICKHLPAGSTATAAIIIPEKQEMYITFGNPCENPYHKYSAH